MALRRKKLDDKGDKDDDDDSLSKPKVEKDNSLRGHTASVECLKFYVSSTGTLRLASGSIDSTVIIWNPGANKDNNLKTLQGHTGPVMCLDSFTRRDGEEGNPNRPGTPILVSGGEDRTLRVWNPDLDSPCIATLFGHEGPIFGLVCFDSTFGKHRVASASEDTTVRVWDLDVKEAQNSMFASGGSKFNPFDRVGGGGGVVPKRRSIGGSAGNVCLMVLEGHSGWVNAVASYTVVAPSRLKGVTQQTPRIVSGSMDNSVRIWDPEAGRLAVLKGHRSWVHSVCCFLTQSGQHRVASASSDHSIRIWDPQSAGGAIVVFNGHKQHVWCVTAFDDKEGRPRIASGGEDRTVRVWNPSQQMQVALHSGHHRPVKCLASFQSTEGIQCLVSGGEDNYIKIWGPGGLGNPGEVVTMKTRTPVHPSGNGRAVGSALGDTTAITSTRSAPPVATPGLGTEVIDPSLKIDEADSQPLKDWLGALHPNCADLLGGFCLRGITLFKLIALESTDVVTLLSSMKVSGGRARAVMNAHALNRVELEEKEEEEEEDSLDAEDEEDEEEGGEGEEAGEEKAGEAGEKCGLETEEDGAAAEPTVSESDN